MKLTKKEVLGVHERCDSLLNGDFGRDGMTEFYHSLESMFFDVRKPLKWNLEMAAAVMAEVKKYVSHGWEGTNLGIEDLWNEAKLELQVEAERVKETQLRAARESIIANDPTVQRLQAELDDAMTRAGQRADRKKS